jgi:hypothetical protein
MDRIREQVNRPLVAAALGFVLGLIIGLPILGWGLWPVQWIDASPEHLREDLQRDWLVMAINSYAQDQDVELARKAWNELGPARMDVFAEVILDPQVDPEAAANYANTVQTQPPQPEAQVQTPITPAEEPAAPAAPAAEGSPVTWLVLLCLGLVVIGGVLAYLLLVPQAAWRHQFQSLARQPQVKPGAGAAHKLCQLKGQEPPVAQFMTTYVLRR